jgi:hypothetical protein
MKTTAHDALTSNRRTDGGISSASLILVGSVVPGQGCEYSAFRANTPLQGRNALHQNASIANEFE